VNPSLNDVLPPVEDLKQRLRDFEITRSNGRVEQVVGLVIESSGPSASVGEACWITPASGTGEPVLAEVVGFRQHRVLLMPLGEMRGLGPGSEVVPAGEPFKVGVGPALLVG
jgi:flagellum-specific ATP synthase